MYHGIRKMSKNSDVVGAGALTLEKKITQTQNEGRQRKPCGV
jgi:hypothetical protein